MANETVETIRYERKMVADRMSVPQIMSVLRTHPAMFRRQFANRVINNIYFDTPAMTSYLSHVAGSPSREKKRIRWYGNPTGVIESPVLERKIKIGSVGTKLYIPLKALPLDEGCPWPIPGRAVSSDKSLDSSLHWSLLAHNPVVAIRYERNYFISIDGRFRVTVDTGLQFFSMSPSGVPQNRWSGQAPVIIEIKYEAEDGEDAEGITNGFPFRLSRFSKYIYAIDGTRINS